MATENVGEKYNKHDKDVVPAENEEDEKSWYICPIHKKDLVPLLCEDCESTVCFDCIVRTHAGHKMCNISECVKKKVEKLNDAILEKESSCFDLKRIRENLQKKRQNIINQKEQIVQRVIDREEEIIREVKNVCQQTIEKITKQASDMERPMIKEEEILKTVMDGGLFQNKTVEDCNRTLHFYNKLEMLNSKYSAQKQNEDEVPFSFVTRDLALDKIVELVGSVLSVEELASDEHVENKENVTNADVTSKKDGKQIQPQHHYQEKVLNKRIDAIVLVSAGRSLLFSERNLYQQMNSEVNKMVESDRVELFTFLPNSDEIVYTLFWDNVTLWRQAASGQGQRTFFMKMNCTKVFAMDHDYACYLRVLYADFAHGINQVTINYYMCFVDEMGCKKKKNVHVGEKVYDTQKYSMGKVRYKLNNFGIVEFQEHRISVTKGFSVDSLFCYSGSVGNVPRSTFSPTDLCRDKDSNFLVVDSFDRTVHLLSSTGVFLRIIMSPEDGIGKIICVAMDTSGWLRFGCADGTVHFADYSYFIWTKRDKRLEEKRNQHK